MLMLISFNSLPEQKLQQNILEPSDKAVMLTKENHAFACVKLGAYDKALKVSRKLHRFIHHCYEVNTQFS